MATLTRQDANIKSELQKLNNALDTALFIAIEGSRGMSTIKGANNEENFKKICAAVIKGIGDIRKVWNAAKISN